MDIETLQLYAQVIGGNDALSSHGLFGNLEQDFEDATQQAASFIVQAAAHMSELDSERKPYERVEPLPEDPNRPPSK